MNKYHHKTTSVLVTALALTIIVACTERQPDFSKENSPDVIQMEVFKQSSCECCGKWVEHLEEAGFAVKTEDRLYLDDIKREFDIEPSYQSCHTGVVDGYVFEGHIPASLIRRFLEEKPEDAFGLAVPDMPIGSPGMEADDRFDSYDVLLLKNDGTSEVYAHVDGPE